MSIRQVVGVSDKVIVAMKLFFSQLMLMFSVIRHRLAVYWTTHMELCFITMPPSVKIAQCFFAKLFMFFFIFKLLNEGEFLKTSFLAV